MAFFHRKVGESHMSGASYLFTAAVSPLYQFCTMKRISSVSSPALSLSYEHLDKSLWMHANSSCVCISQEFSISITTYTQSLFLLKNLALFFLPTYMTPSIWPRLSKCSCLLFFDFKSAFVGSQASWLLCHCSFLMDTRGVMIL